MSFSIISLLASPLRESTDSVWGRQPLPNIPCLPCKFVVTVATKGWHAVTTCGNMIKWYGVELQSHLHGVTRVICPDLALALTLHNYNQQMFEFHTPAVQKVLNAMTTAYLLLIQTMILLFTYSCHIFGIHQRYNSQLHNESICSVLISRMYRRDRRFEAWSTVDIEG